MAHPRPIPSLTCDDPFDEAARKVVATRLEEFVSFWPDVRSASRDDPDRVERVHDMRVASRRLRAGLEAFEGAFAKKPYRSALKETKALASALGEVRDMDVLIERVSKDRKGLTIAERKMRDSIRDELVARREKASKALQSTLSSAEAKVFERAWRPLLREEGKWRKRKKSAAYDQNGH